ncbi:MAG: hypothetical protein ACNS60_00100 [Candidatus Cyclobacteriaceae bacterium M2_1C_046]
MSRIMKPSLTVLSKRILLTTGAAIAFVILYLFISQPGFAQTMSNNSIQIKENSGKRTIKYKSNSALQNFEIEYQGKIEVTDDDRAVKSISPGGFLEISKTTFGSKRELVIESDGNGQLSKKYFEGRKEIAYDPAGKKWLSEILPEIVRTTRIAAESRVNRFYNSGGANAVLNEIEKLESNYVQVHYADLLLQKKDLRSADLISIADKISSVVESDYYLASLLKKHSSLFLNDPKASEAFFAGLTNIDSDYYLAVVLKHALKESKPSPAAMKKVLAAVDKINSDYYQTVVISTLLEEDNLTGEVLSSLVSASKNIDSDYYKSSVLKKALGHKNLSENGFNILLNEISSISSDYYMANIFGELLESDLNSNMKIHIVNTVSERMSSDYYLSNLLVKSIDQGNLTTELTEAISNALRNVNSDHYASTVIKKAAERTSSMDKKTAIALIKATEYIDSDFYQSEALIALSEVVNRSNNSELSAAYREAARNISSDTYYGKALKALE